MTDGKPKAQVIWLWLDHPRLGCGRRQYRVLVGRKWARLERMADGRRAKLPMADYRAALKAAGTPIKEEKRRRRSEKLPPAMTLSVKMVEAVRADSELPAFLKRLQ